MLKYRHSLRFRRVSACMSQLLSEHFVQLDQVLTQYQPFWRFSPFHLTSLPWPDSELTRYLHQLDQSELELLERDSAKSHAALLAFFPQLKGLNSVATALPNRFSPDTAEPPFWFSRDIKGRKLQQIQAFAWQMQRSDLPVLEWCAGKGHLGRWLAFSQERQVTSLEWQESLCREGQLQAKKLRLPQHFVQTDVLADKTSGYLHAEQQIVALHACGDLHVRLLQQASQQSTKQLDIVPCCYHLMASATYQALSTLAQRSALGELSRDELKLAVQAQVTAGDRVARLRHTEVLWRMAYQELYQAQHDVTEYQPLASVPKHWFSGEFSAFAHWAAAQHQWTIPAQINWDYYLQLGLQRQLLVQKMQLVRSLFRPLLEQWLVLDRALFLQQQGYQVQVKQFCDYQLTPRNLMISAQKC